MRNFQLAPEHQRGVALIEALVSILIFAIGVLALLGLQALGLKAASDGKYRADAAYLANQLVSQIWADDRFNVPNYTYNYSCTVSGAAATSCTFSCNSATALTAGNVSSAPTFMQAWLNQLLGHFPGGSIAQVLVVTNPPSAWQVSATYTVGVSICWRMPSDPAGQYHNYVTSAQIS